MKESIASFPVNPKWPTIIPAKSTKVTPKEIPKNLIFPNRTPTAITKEYSNTMCAIELGSVNNDSSQFIIYFRLDLKL